MTNGDVLRAMNNEALADFLNTLKYNCCDGKCGDCPVSGYKDVEGDCSVEEWLTELKQRIEAAASYETSNLSEVAGCDQFICKECGLHLEDWYRLDGDAWLEKYEFKFCPNCGRKVREEVIE